MSYEPGLDVVVCNYRTAGDLQDFLRSFREHPMGPAELTVVNVAPRVDDVRVVEAWGPQVAFHYVEWADNVGYARACNRAAAKGTHSVIGFFNADVVLTRDALWDCFSAIESHPGWGVLGPRQVDESFRITAGGVLGQPERPELRAWHEADRGQCSDIRTDAVTVSGAAYFVRRSLWDELTACPAYQEVAPGAEGAFLPTQHYYEETFCLPGDAFVWAETGPRPLSQVTVGDRVWAFDGDKMRVAPVSWAGQTGVKKIVRIEMKGRVLRASEDHPVLVVDGVRPNGSGGSLEWRKVGEVQAGDRLVVVGELPVPGDGPVDAPPWRVDEGDLLQLLGMYVGDGCHDARAVTIALPPEARVRATYERLARGVVRRRGFWTRRGRPSQGQTFVPPTIQAVSRAFRVSSVEFVRYLLAAGFDGLAHTKRVPSWVFLISRELRLRFLAGIVDSDGTVGSDGKLVLTLANRALIEDVRQLLVSCGLPVSAPSLVAGKDVAFPQGHVSRGRDAWCIICCNPAGIPFADSLYRQRLRSAPRRPGRSMGAAALPPGLVSRRVRSVKSEGEEPVYDLEVAGPGSFVAEGVVVHNCSYHARAHGHDCVFYGPVQIFHKWHRASTVGGPADRQFEVSRAYFRRACDAHQIAHD